MLAYHSTLKCGYKIYQEFLSAVHNQDAEHFEQLLTSDSSNFPEPFQPVIQMFWKYRQEIQLALSVPNSNGPLEGLNKHIKVLKRMAYDFHSFENFQQQIFLYREKYFRPPLFPPKKKQLDNRS